MQGRKTITADNQHGRTLAAAHYVIPATQQYSDCNMQNRPRKIYSTTDKPAQPPSAKLEPHKLTPASPNPCSPKLTSRSPKPFLQHAI